MTKKLSILLTAVLLFTVSSAVFAEAEEVSVVAEVNGTGITSVDVRREMNMMYQQSVMQGVYPDESEIQAYWDRALEVLIGRELLLQAAEQKNYKADSVAVEDYINGLMANYGGSEALEAALAEQGMTLDKLRADTVRYQLISIFVDKELRNKVSVSEQDIVNYYQENEQYFMKEETVRASHILIKTSEGADEAELKSAYERITAIEKRLLAGENFAELATETSECPSSENGGDLGEFGHGMMVPPFDRAVFALKPGELSKPVQTQFGYHLIKLVEKNAGEKMVFADVKQQISDYLIDRMLEEQVDEYVGLLREDADVEFFKE